MGYRAISFAVLLIAMYWIGIAGDSISPTLVLGFLVLAAYGVGFFLEKTGLPRITGYIVAGLLLGPYFGNFCTGRAISDLDFLNSLALAVIGFCAGAELKIDHLRANIRTITYILAGTTLTVIAGVTLAVFAVAPFIPFVAHYSPVVRLAIAALFGVICASMSPAAAIAIISETKADGPFTEAVMAVTVVVDVVVIVLFAVTLSVCQLLINPQSPFDMGFVANLFGSIAIALTLGFGLGKGVVFLIRKVHLEFPVVIATTGFLVIKFCHLLGEYLHHIYHITLDLEPLLICMAAGFTVENFSRHGDDFIAGMDRVALPVYVAFFAITGAKIQVDLLREGWVLGLLLFGVRAVTIYLGSRVGGRRAGQDLSRKSWMGFMPQAGVSLGLLSEVARRVPGIGVSMQTILIATITLNQIIGPVAFKYALEQVGEARAKSAAR